MLLLLALLQKQSRRWGAMGCCCRAPFLIPISLANRVSPRPEQLLGLLPPAPWKRRARPGTTRAVMLRDRVRCFRYATLSFLSPSPPAPH